MNLRGIFRGRAGACRHAVTPHTPESPMVPRACSPLAEHPSRIRYLFTFETPVSFDSNR